MGGAAGASASAGADGKDYNMQADRIIKQYFGKSPEGLYRCNACGQVQKHQSNLRAHVESKHYSPGYPCPSCGRVFKLRNSCRQHQKNCMLKHL